MLINSYKLPIEARDFNSIGESLFDFVEIGYGGAVDDITTHSLLALNIDMLALVGDAFFRSAERNAQGGNLATAVEPQQVLDIALRDHGYVPSPPVAAEHTMRATASSSVSFLIPAGTVFETVPIDGSAAVKFETLFDFVKPFGATNIDFSVKQGVSVTQTETSTGTASMIFEINSTVIDLSTINVRIDGFLWEYVDSFVNSLPTSRHYRVIVTEPAPGERRYWLLFGDGSLGRIPSIGYPIEVAYLAGGGTLGNVALGTITKLVSPSSFFDGSGNPISVQWTNVEQTIRGAEAEDIDVVRIKAPLTAAIHGGVVSRADYEAAALILGAARARALTYNEDPAIAPNLVVLYVAFDLDNVPTQTELDDLKDAIESEYRTNGTALLAVVPIQFQDFSIDIQITAQTGVDASELYVTASTLITEFFSLTSVVGPVPKFIIDIGRPVYLSHLVELIESIEGVDHVEIPSSSIPSGGFTYLEPDSDKLPDVIYTLTVS